MPDSIGRLRRRADFLRVAAGRRRFAAPGLVMQVHPTPKSEDQDGLRVGFTVTKKVGAATIRNRAKRRLREVARQVLPAHGAKGQDFVVIGRKGTLHRPYAALVGDMETALQKLKVWRNDQTDIR